MLEVRRRLKELEHKSGEAQNNMSAKVALPVLCKHTIALPWPPPPPPPSPTHTPPNITAVLHSWSVSVRLCVGGWHIATGRNVQV